jgi:hypothetical protein
LTDAVRLLATPAGAPHVRRCGAAHQHPRGRTEATAAPSPSRPVEHPRRDHRHRGRAST